MMLGVLMENIALLPQLPWIGIVIGSIAAYAIGWGWYGVLFQKQYMRLIENKREKTNWTAMGVQYLGLLTLAYLIGIFSLFPTMFLLGLDALIGVILFLSLAGVLFQRGNTRNAMQFWLITAGYDIVAVLSAALCIIYFA